MFDTIILLCGEVEQSVLPHALRGHNPQLAVIPVRSQADLDRLDSHLLRRSRLIAFVTPVIVPADILHRLGYGAFNFHPGPPDYPGWAPAHFALYARATEFGATAHVMVARVDEGPIVGALMFSIPPGSSVASLEGMAYARISSLFWTLANRLATDSEPLPELPLQWSGTKSTRRDYAALCDVPIDIHPDELDHRIEVFGEDPNFGSRCTFAEPIAIEAA